MMKYKPQKEWKERNKMLKVGADFKEDFVLEYRDSLDVLGLQQSDLIREMMENVINEANTNRKGASSSKVDEMSQLFTRVYLKRRNNDDVREQIYIDLKGQINSEKNIAKGILEYIGYDDFVKKDLVFVGFSFIYLNEDGTVDSTKRSPKKKAIAPALIEKALKENGDN